MKQVSIYSALGMAETASEREVGHALRQALRENYKKTRDNFGMLEDSLRFYNQTSQILKNKERRKLYDAEWALLHGSETQRIDFVLREAAEGKLAAPLGDDGALLDVDATAAVRLVTEVGATPRPVLSLELVPEHADLGPQVLLPRLTSVTSSATPVSPQPISDIPFQGPASGIAPTVASLASLSGSSKTTSRSQSAPLAAPTTQHYHPILTENIGYSRSPIFHGLAGGLTALVVGALFYLTWGYVAKPFDVEQSWVWVVLFLMGLLLYIFGRQRGLKRRGKEFDLPGMPDEEAIKGWRRKRTIFLGSNFLAEDPSWVFQLRLTELERARIGRTSYAHPWRRALARLFDYALWGWLLFFPLHELANHELIPMPLFTVLGNPLLAPILITFTWIPIEALLMAAVGTTLGKWLFGVYVQFQASTPYALRSSGACWRYALQRAFCVWWQGVSMGTPLLPVAVARARAALERFDETDWDGEQDVLVTHTPVNAMTSLISGSALAILLFMYVASWQKPLFDMVEDVGRFAMQRVEYWQTARVNPTISLPPREAVFPSSPVTPVGRPAVPTALTPDEIESARKLEEFREAIVNIREESLLLLEKKDWKRAYESCQKWARLEITNPAPMRCQGVALQSMGKHQEAINAFRSAKIYAPEDRSLDEAITRSQDEIFKALNR